MTVCVCVCVTLQKVCEQPAECSQQSTSQLGAVQFVHSVYYTYTEGKNGGRSSEEGRVRDEEDRKGERGTRRVLRGVDGEGGSMR